MFVHGLWLHGTSWGAWEELFREAGYEPVAPGWPGDSATVEETRSDPAKVAGYGIDDVVEHYAQIIRSLDGRAIVDRSLVRRPDRAAAARAGPRPPPPSRSTRRLSRACSACQCPPCAWPRSRCARLPTATWPCRSPREQFRYGFGNALPERECAELYERWAVPSPGKPLFEAASANFTLNSPAKVNTQNKTRGPLLLTAGGKDHTVPKAITTATAEAVPQVPGDHGLRGVPRPRPLAHHRQRLARSRAVRARLAGQTPHLGRQVPASACPAQRFVYQNSAEIIALTRTMCLRPA